MKIKDIKKHFLSKVRQCHRTGCWLWLGGKDRRGYGKFLDGRANRHAWAIFNGPIPDGYFVCHKCDNPSCANPEHLFLGTPLDNMRDMIAKGRAAHHEKHPRAKLTKKQVIFIREKYKPRSRAFGTRALARKFEVSQALISDIVTNKVWRFLT